MFREIGTKERLTEEGKRREEEKKWNNGAGQIKPERNITIEEVRDFWMNLCASEEEA